MSSTIKEAFENLIAAVDNVKSNLATAITAKGVQTNSTDTFAKIIENIGKIQTGVPKPKWVLKGYNKKFEKTKDEFDHRRIQDNTYEVYRVLEPPKCTYGHLHTTINTVDVYSMEANELYYYKLVEEGFENDYGNGYQRDDFLEQIDYRNKKGYLLFDDDKYYIYEFDKVSESNYEFNPN